MNNENDFDKNENILPFTDFLNSNSNNFSLLFTNIEESKKLLQSYETFINKYFVSINFHFKQLTEFNSNFLTEDRFKSSVINSPIFQLGKAIKKAVQAQIDNLFSIITNQKIFFVFLDALSKLSKILEESPSKIGKGSSHKNGPDDQIRPVVITLMENFAEIESKVTDEYIYSKYNKHVLGINDKLLKDNIEQAIFLEKTFLVFEEDTKKHLLNNFQEMEKKTIEIFNEMKGIVKNIIDILRENNSTYLDELQNEIDLIGKIQKNPNKSFNNSYISVHNNESEIDIKPKDNLDMLKYRIKIIQNPKIQIIHKVNKIENKEMQNNGNKKSEENLNNKESEENKTKDLNNENLKKFDNEIRNRNNNSIEKDNLENTEELYNDGELILSEEDVFNIVTTLYSYDFKMLNKSEYDLKIEETKLKVSKLTEKLLTFDGENNINEKITDQEVNNLYDLLNDRDTFLKFFIMLNNYRSTGRCQATERAFNIIMNIFSKAQDYLINNREIVLEGLIIILSQTFFLMKDGQKIYLQKVIKEHKLFKNGNFWKNYLDDIIEQELDKNIKDQLNSNTIIIKEDQQRKLNEIFLSKIIPLANYMNDFELPEDIIMSIIIDIFERYNINDEGKSAILSLLEKGNY